MDDIHKDASEAEKHRLLDEWLQIITGFVGKLAAGTIHLDDRDDAQCEKDKPNGTVALKMLFYRNHIVRAVWLRGDGKNACVASCLLCMHLLLELLATVLHVLEQVETGAARTQQHGVAGLC